MSVPAAAASADAVAPAAPVPVWPRRLAIASVLVVAATVFALSFVAISEVAVAVGAVNPGMGWLVPIAFDGGIIAGCATLWAQALEGRRSWRSSLFVAVLLGLSVWVNVEHTDGALLARVIAGSPPVILFGALELVALPLEVLTAAADAWAEALDAAGANDRLRAFTDAVDRLTRHDNPHGHALNQALADGAGGPPLDPGAAGPPTPAPRRPRRRSHVRRWRLPARAAAHDHGQQHADQPGRRGRRNRRRRATAAFHDAARLGLGPDASLGDIMQAQGVDPDAAEADMLAMLEAFDPAAAYAWLATDGLLLTEENIRLVDPADAQRWQEAGGAYEAVFEHADQLLDADAEEDAWFDARTEAAGIALDELGAASTTAP